MTIRLPRRRALFILAAGAAAPSALLAAGVKTVQTDGRAELEAFLANVTSAEGRFRQRVLDRSGKLVNDAEGVFAFRRPGAFLWNYEKPWRQQIVSDGATLWLYDEDLMQVTVKKMTDTLGTTPAAVLFGDGGIPKSWKVESDAHAAALTPDQPQAGFEAVLIAFDDAGMPKLMRLLDSFGQTTEVAFIDFKALPDIDQTRFVFEIPEGVDVLKDG